MTRFLQWYQLAKSMGIRYVLFRISFEFKRKSGLLKRSYPINPPFKTWVTLAQWRATAPVFFFNSRSDFKRSSEPSSQLLQEATRILAGQVQFFHGEWRTIDPHDWLTNVTTGHRYNNQQHWTEIPDFHPQYGDIKYVWERSRFSFVQTILRYDAQSGADSSAWVFAQIESWIENNPINQGPNYRCSQETSLRVFNWTLALYFYRHSAILTEDRFTKILFHLYWQLRHVRSNIHFSRIAVRNNHAITETLALYTGGLLFPFFEEAKEWKVSGKKWFEEEIAYQVYDDGTYLQFSFNYQRVVIQLLTWGIALAHRHQDEFSRIVYERTRACLNILVHCQDSVSGELPNYGANDGSLFFDWNDEAFRNFKPSLDAIHYLLTSSNLYAESFEDRLWFGTRAGLARYQPIVVAEGHHSFSTGGIYVYRQGTLLVWINCVHYKNRPSQADALHLDVWYRGQNMLQDAGSYRYNAEVEKVKYFFGTESHNTVMVEEQDQMVKGPRFIWLKWSGARNVGWARKGDETIFQGMAQVYQHLGKVWHTRTIRIDAQSLQLTVHDQLTGLSGALIRQLWHVKPELKDVVNFISTDAEGRKEELKYFSPTYGVLEKSLQVEFQTHNKAITTQIKLS